jgi:C4-dicarboxylate-binding protein DctP
MYLRLLGAVLLLLAACLPVAAESIQIGISSSARPESPLALATDYLGKLIEERSGGRIRISAHAAKMTKPFDPSSRLQTELGLLDKKLLSRRQPRLQIFDLLFLFAGRQHLYQVLDSPLGAQILTAPDTDNLVNLSFWDEGFRQLAGEQLLVDPAQLDGMTLKVTDQQAAARQYAALGALPLVAGSTANGVAREISLARLSEPVSERFRHLTLSDQAVDGKLLVVKRDFWQQLPRDLQVIITGAVKDATRYARELSLEQEKKLLEQLTKTAERRTHRLTPQQKKQWQNQLRGIYPKIVAADELQLVELIMEQSSTAAH